MTLTPPPLRMQQDSSLLASETSPDRTSQERHHHPHLLASSLHHLSSSPEASDCSTEMEHRRTAASTLEISVSSDSEFEPWSGRWSDSGFLSPVMKRAVVRLRLTCLQLWKQTWSWSLKQEDEDLTLQHENIMHLKKPHHNSDNESSDMMMQTMLTKKKHDHDHERPWRYTHVTLQ